MTPRSRQAATRISVSVDRNSFPTPGSAPFALITAQVPARRLLIQNNADMAAKETLHSECLLLDASMMMD
jgi:hypothetical protein